MRNALRALLLAAALLISQHAAMLHGFAHAEHEIALASHDDGKAPMLDHGVDACSAFAAFAHGLGNSVAVQPCPGSWIAAVPATFNAATAATRIAFDSRAPPLSA